MYSLPRFLPALLCLLLVTACADDTGSLDDAEPDIQDDAVTDPTLGPVPEGDTVASVDVASYVGLWYEQASIPQGFQRNCAATTATYDVIDSSTISVLNSCRIGGVDGEPVQIEGTATVVDPTSNAKLEVSFGFGTSPYWIVDLGVREGDEPYPWAAVSTPGREALWILSREPKMPDERFAAIVDRLEQRGFQPERLSATEQPE